MMLNLFVIFKVGTRSLYLTECDWKQSGVEYTYGQVERIT
jgi:hypothetical protein